MLQSSSIYFPDVGKQVPFSVALVVRWRDASFWKPSSLLINHLQQQNSQRLGPNYTSTFTQGCTSKPQKRTTKWRCGMDFVFHRVAIWFNLSFFGFMCVCFLTWQLIHGMEYTSHCHTHRYIYIYTYIFKSIYIYIYGDLSHKISSIGTATSFRFLRIFRFWWMLILEDNPFKKQQLQ